ncbi:MAG TPA: hypothetical protein VH591_06965 [Ktedonobacterales bacterium]|jgi:hypothetical protein
MDYLRRTGRDTGPLASRPKLWGCGGLLIGLVIGILATLLGLFVLAPRPQAASPVSSVPGGELGIALDDVYLTQLLTDAMSSSTLPIHLSNIQAEILPGDQIKMSATTSGQLPISAPLAATAQVRLESGQPTIHFVSAQVGGLPLPAAITTALEKPVNTKLAQTMANLLPPESTVTGLSTTEHHLLMTISNNPG